LPEHAQIVFKNFSKTIVPFFLGTPLNTSCTGARQIKEMLRHLVDYSFSFSVQQPFPHCLANVAIVSRRFRFPFRYVFLHIRPRQKLICMCGGAWGFPAPD